MYVRQMACYARRGWGPGLLLALVSWLAWPAVSLAQSIDICQCSGLPKSSPAPGDFDSTDNNAWPPGTTQSLDTITIPLPLDGRLVFNNFTVRNAPGRTSGATVIFVHPADSTNGNRVANTPVSLLATGNVEILTGTNGSAALLSVSGSNGIGGSSGTFGVGGQGGPGGFRGGDGAYQLVNFANNGGNGLGPGGGRGGTASPFTNGSPGTFVGVPGLLPLVGGSGGGRRFHQ